MIEILVRNAHGNLNEKHRDYAAKKLGKLDRYFRSANRVEIAHIEEKLGHHIEVTVFADGITLRGEETDPHVHAAIDKVADKLETRLRRMKSRIIKRHRTRGEQTPMGLEDISIPDEEIEEETFVISEHKPYDMRPISVEDAALQMDLLGVDFYAFRNVETNEVEVLYRTKRGGFGLLSPGR